MNPRTRTRSHGRKSILVVFGPRTLWRTWGTRPVPQPFLQPKSGGPAAWLEMRGRVCKWACKPNSVEDDHSSRRHIAAPLKRPTRRFWRAGPARSRRFGRIPSLFGLAPCGVYPATAFTDGAVRSYRTFSPLPPAMKPRAVCSLWHWPSLSLDAQIPDVIRHTALRSSDFPLPKHASAPAATARHTCSSYASPSCGVCVPKPRPRSWQQ